MRPCLSPSMNQEFWADSAYSTTPSGSKVRKSNSAANLTRRNGLNQLLPCIGGLVFASFKRLTLYSLAVGSARTSQEGPKTAPPGTASRGVCSRTDPHTQGSARRSDCPPPSAGPDGRHSGTRSCPPCLCRSRHTHSPGTHPRLEQQEVEKMEADPCFFIYFNFFLIKQFPLARWERVEILPLQVLEVKL